MKKIKNICKNTLSHIKKIKLLKYAIMAIIITIIVVPIGFKLNNKNLNNKENNKEENVSDKQDGDKGVTKGTIYTDVTGDNVYSSHTLSDGFSTLSDDSISDSSESTSNQNDIVSDNSSNMSNNIDNSPSISKNIDNSSISGINLEILEGDEFYPKKDLKLQATDKDGSNISDNIIIEKNTVNTTVPGIYTVKASVKLSNGQIKEKEFSVTVKETRLDVSLESFKPMKSNVKKGEKIGFYVDFKVSKRYINPISVMINGKEYSVYEGNDNIIDKLINSKNYKVVIDGSDVSGIHDYNLEYVKMSNGSYISLGQNIQTVEILKNEASINNFNYEEKSKDKKVDIKFDLVDLDNTVSNLRLQLYKKENLLEDVKLDKMNNYCISLPVNSNGIYTLKILSDINLNQNATKENTSINKEIFSTTINISNIDQTSISGNDIEITQGQDLDVIKDLGLKATDFDGEDITDKIEIDSKDIDVNDIGKQSVVVSIINKNGKKYTKEFYVTVNEVDSDKSILSRILFRNSNNVKSIKSRFIVSGDNEQTLSQTVTLTGTISKSDGTAPNGKIQVELPTAMSFIVDKNGEISSGTYTVSNKSDVGISVYVDSFTDSNNNSGIEVRPTDEDISGLDRSNVHLTLHGNTGNTVDLVNIEKGKNKLLTVNSLSSEVIQLTGNAGKGKDKSIDNMGAKDDFTLVFRIKKN